MDTMPREQLIFGFEAYSWTKARMLQVFEHPGNVDRRGFSNFTRRMSVGDMKREFKRFEDFVGTNYPLEMYSFRNKASAVQGGSIPPRPSQAGGSNASQLSATSNWFIETPETYRASMSRRASRLNTASTPTPLAPRGQDRQIYIPNIASASAPLAPRSQDRPIHNAGISNSGNDPHSATNTEEGSQATPPSSTPQSAAAQDWIVITPATYESSRDGA